MNLNNKEKDKSSESERLWVASDNLPRGRTDFLC